MLGQVLDLLTIFLDKSCRRQNVQKLATYLKVEVANVLHLTSRYSRSAGNRIPTALANFC